jgi:hypothetical protein
VYTMPLLGMCANGLPFIWWGIHDKCFEMIKAIASKKLTLCLIDQTSSDPGVVCDVCPSGCRAYYSQGEDWKTMKPASFMSKKFTDMQCLYFAYEERLKHSKSGTMNPRSAWDSDHNWLQNPQNIYAESPQQTMPNMLVTMVFTIPIEIHSHSGITKLECWCTITIIQKPK